MTSLQAINITMSFSASSSFVPLLLSLSAAFLYYVLFLLFGAVGCTSMREKEARPVKAW